jgi:hypothetical protein
MTHFNRIRGTRYTRYEVYEGSADAAWKAAALCLGTVPVVGYNSCYFINYKNEKSESCSIYNWVVIVILWSVKVH